MRYSKEDKLLKQYLEYLYGKHAASIWIRYPKHELFKLLAKENDKKWFKIMQKAVQHDQDYVLRLLFGIKKPFTIDYSIRIAHLQRAFEGLL
jgi:hypothetical protein